MTRVHAGAGVFCRPGQAPAKIHAPQTSVEETPSSPPPRYAQGAGMQHTKAPVARTEEPPRPPRYAQGVGIRHADQPAESKQHKVPERPVDAAPHFSALGIRAAAENGVEMLRSISVLRPFGQKANE